MSLFSDFIGFIFGITLFFLAGFLTLRALFGSKHPFSAFEIGVLSFALGIGILDFSMIFLGAQGVAITKATAILSLIGLPLSFLFIRHAHYRVCKKKSPVSPNDTGAALENASPFSSTKNEKIAFVVLISLTVLLRTLFLGDAGLPTATDLGHHMYWSKQIQESGEIPVYEKREIIGEDGKFFLSDPVPISDFIVGEHIPFAALAFFSSNFFFSSLPVTALYLINLLSLLAVFSLSVRLTAGILTKQSVSPFSVGLAVLFFLGPLFAFSSPESKFVSGGVVGNLFGNLFIPVILALLFRALREKEPRFLALGIFLSLTLAYTHHLSSLVLLFIFMGIFFSLLLLFPRDAVALGRRIGRLFLSPYPLFVLVCALLFFFFVAMPTYIETNAVTTAIGAPSKSTRTGLTFFQASDASGLARISLGLSALLLGFFVRKIRNSIGFSFILGWTGSLLAMTLAPHLLFLDIPSNRIGAYLAAPLALLSGALVALIPFFLKARPRKHPHSYIPGKIFLFALLIVFGFSAWNGSNDNQSSLPSTAKKAQMRETYDGAAYLASRLREDDIVLKDHNYLVGDSWIKLFFMRGYEYPLSRGFFKRYEDETKPREQCTLLMISTPNLRDGEKCFEDLGVNLVMVHPEYDASQFEKSSAFSRIYSGKSLHIYERK